MIKEFTLGAVKWNVEIDNGYLDKKQAYGEADYDKSSIKLQDISNGSKRSELAIEQTLYHEVVHSILDAMGDYRLSHNEKFVQQFSLLLHQFEKTKQ